MCYLNLLTPLYADDFAYRFSFADKGLKIHNLESLIQSQKMHYITMNGRLCLSQTVAMKVIC